jgi:hypothetical protein
MKRGEFCQSFHSTVKVISSWGCETLSPNDVSDRPTLGTDFHSRNRAVGRPDGHFGEVVFPVLWHKRSKTGRRGVSEETGYQCSGPLRSPAGASSLATKGKFLHILQTSKS